MLHNRRRNRFNGSARLLTNGLLSIRVEQAFGNCPQYINERIVEAASDQQQSNVAATVAVRGVELSDDLIGLIRRADTMFLGSGWNSSSNLTTESSLCDLPQHGMDASHRGGPPGFVSASAKRLQFIDRKGNNLFNTIGNLVQDPRVGVLFVDFENGGLLHVSGRAMVVFDESVERDVSIDIDEFVWRPSALPLRWHLSRQSRPLVLVRRVLETDDVASLFFVSAHQGRPLDSFVGGQYLPIRIGDQERTYSLSGPPHAALGHLDDFYRVTVKNVGQVSCQLHNIAVGSIIEATSRPQGEFVLAGNLSAAGTLVFIGGGVGVTPLISMAHSVLDNAHGPRIEFHVSAGNWSSVVLRDELIAMTASSRMLLVVHLTKDSVDAPESQKNAVTIVGGRICRETFRAVSDDIGDNNKKKGEKEYYVCGPSAFMLAVSAALRANGVKEEAIHSESFGPSAL